MILSTWAFCVTLLAILSLQSPLNSSDPTAYKEIFDGHTLHGWIQRNGSATYVVEDGAIIGQTTEGSPNSFLCSQKEYSDFELVFEVMVDDALNSGIQIRSKSTADYNNYRVHGPQVEISVNNAGYVYGEALGTGWLSPTQPKHNHFRAGQWNSYRVLAVGPVIKTWINGEQIASVRMDRPGFEKGFIGLQVHSIPEGKGPYNVRWKNLKIRELGVSARPADYER